MDISSTVTFPSTHFFLFLRKKGKALLGRLWKWCQGIGVRMEGFSPLSLTGKERGRRAGGGVGRSEGAPELGAQGLCSLGDTLDRRTGSMPAKGSGERTMTAWGFLQSSVGVFRAVGFLVNPAEAAKGTAAFKRANEEEKMSLGSSVPAPDVATARCCSPGLRAAPAPNPLKQEASLPDAQRSQFRSQGNSSPLALKT